jgi:hypothetical protein
MCGACRVTENGEAGHLQRSGEHEAVISGQLFTRKLCVPASQLTTSGAMTRDENPVGFITSAFS